MNNYRLHNVPPAATPYRHQLHSRMAALLDRAGEGDQAAFAEFYDATIGAVYGSAVLISHDALHAELITERVYMAAWVAAPQFDSAKTPPDSWLWSIAAETAEWQAEVEHKH